MVNPDAEVEPETRQFVCRYPSALLDELDVYAKAHDLTRAQVVRQAARELLARNNGPARAEPEGTR